MIITTLLGALVVGIAGGSGLRGAWSAVRAVVRGRRRVRRRGNATKVAHGGWAPLVLAAMMFTVFVIWRDGCVKLRAELEDRAVPIAVSWNGCCKRRDARARHRGVPWS